MQTIIDKTLLSVVAKNLTWRIRQYHLGMIVDRLPERFRFTNIDFTEEDVFKALLDMAIEASIVRLSRQSSEVLVHDLTGAHYEEPNPMLNDPYVTYSAFNAFLKVCNEGNMYEQRDYKWISRLKRELACSIVSNSPQCKNTPWGHIPHKEVGVDD